MVCNQARIGAAEAQARHRWARLRNERLVCAAVVAGLAYAGSYGSVDRVRGRLAGVNQRQATSRHGQGAMRRWERMGQCGRVGEQRGHNAAGAGGMSGSHGVMQWAKRRGCDNARGELGWAPGKGAAS